MAAAPDHKAWVDEAQREALALRASRVMGLAAETCNDVLRAYSMAFAATAWFLSPWAIMAIMAIMAFMAFMALMALMALMAVTVGVVWILYRREFHSDLLAVLADDVPAG